MFSVFVICIEAIIFCYYIICMTKPLSFKAQPIKTIMEKFLNKEEPGGSQYLHIRRNCSIMKYYVRDVYVEWDTSPR